WEREANGWRSLLPSGTSFPFALLFLAYTLVDAVTLRALHVANERGASPYHSEMSVADGLGGKFVLSDPSAWEEGLFITTVLSAAAQRAVLAVWIAFGCGRWFSRLGIAVVTSAFLYVMIRSQLSAPEESWRGVLVPIAAIPLQILLLATPLA